MAAKQFYEFGPYRLDAGERRSQRPLEHSTQAKNHNFPDWEHQFGMPRR